jgi:putative PIN family toxin of toxin-antitoxin system
VIIVLDTSVLISTLISKGTPPQQLYLHWLEDVFELVTSEAQLTEYTRVIQYKRLQKYISVPEAQSLLGHLRRKARVLDVLPDVDLSPDPDDNPILATAIAGEADYLVSGDKENLLSLGEVEGIPIITARTALDLLEPKEPPEMD